MLSLDRQGPLYLQVYRSLRRAILDGTYAVGGRLPSSRRLARELGVSRNVALLAFDQLGAEGYLDGRRGSGTYVAAAPPPADRSRPTARAVSRQARLARYGRRALAAAAERPGRSKPVVRYDFRYGFAPPDAASLLAWGRLVARHVRAQPLDYAPASGDVRLRRALAVHLRRSRGIACDPDQIVIVNGSQQGIDLAARLLVDPGDRVLIEDPSYQGARRIFAAAGAALVPVAVDDDGLDLSPASRARRAARLAYVTPSHQFPTGAVMPLGRRLALLDWAARHDAYVLEDDYDSEFRYEGRPIEAVHALDRRDRTIYVGTLSKVLFPSLRLGFLVVPTGLVEAVCAAKWMADRHSPALEQTALAEFIVSGQFDRHLRRMRRRHAARREALVRAIETHLAGLARAKGTRAGMHLLLWLTGVAVERLDDLVEAAARSGLGLYSIAPYYLRRPPRAGLLMGYGALEPDDIDAAVRILARVLDRFSESHRRVV